MLDRKRLLQRGLVASFFPPEILIGRRAKKKITTLHHCPHIGIIIISIRRYRERRLWTKTEAITYTTVCMYNMRILHANSEHWDLGGGAAAAAGVRRAESVGKKQCVCGPMSPSNTRSHARIRCYYSGDAIYIRRRPEGIYMSISFVVVVVVVVVCIHNYSRTHFYIILYICIYVRSLYHTRWSLSTCSVQVHYI